MVLSLIWPRSLVRNGQNPENNELLAIVCIVQGFLVNKMEFEEESNLKMIMFFGPIPILIIIGFLITLQKQSTKKLDFSVSSEI